MTNTKPIRRVAIIGTGVIGASWAAQYPCQGLKSSRRTLRPTQSRAAEVREVGLAGARSGWAAVAGASLANLEVHRRPRRSCCRCRPRPGERAGAVGLQTEAVPKQLDELLPPDVIIASSSSGIKMSDIQSGVALHPERCVIGHPFNPPHLIPLVRGSRRDQDLGADDPARDCVLQVDREEGRTAQQGNAGPCRQTACRVLWRGKSTHLIAEGCAERCRRRRRLVLGAGSALGHHGQHDAQSRLGGGAGGIEHFLHQFAGPMTASWKTLGSPELTPEVKKKLIDGVHAEVGSRTIEELEAERDEISCSVSSNARRPEGLTTGRARSPSASTCQSLLSA